MLREFAVCGGDYSDVDLMRLRRADPNDLAVRKNTQQFRLCLQRHLANLIEKQGTFMCGFEQPTAAPVRARKSSPLVAKQLAFEQRRWQRRAIDCHKRLFRARAGSMDSPGNEFLSCSLFAKNQHARSCWGDARDEATHGLDGFRIAADF